MFIFHNTALRKSHFHERSSKHIIKTYACDTSDAWHALFKQCDYSLIMLYVRLQKLRQWKVKLQYGRKEDCRSVATGKEKLTPQITVGNTYRRIHTSVRKSRNRQTTITVIKTHLAVQCVSDRRDGQRNKHKTENRTHKCCKIAFNLRDVNHKNGGTQSCQNI